MKTAAPLALYSLASLLFLAAFRPASAQVIQVDAEEFKRLVGEVADLREAYQAQSRKITALQSEVEKLRGSIRDSSEKTLTKMGDFVVRDDLKKMADSIKEVDQKRDADKKLILDEIEKLGKTLLATPAPSESRRKPKKDPEPREQPDREENVIKYKVEKGDFLSTIIASYNSTLKEQNLPRVTLEDVKRVNPSINVNRLYEGQEILLPVPSKGAK